MNLTVFSFLGIINVGEPHSDLAWGIPLKLFNVFCVTFRDCQNLTYSQYPYSYMSKKTAVLDLHLLCR